VLLLRDAPQPLTQSELIMEFLGQCRMRADAIEHVDAANGDYKIVASAGALFGANEVVTVGVD
jgi:hypothetical protein